VEQIQKCNSLRVILPLRSA